MSNSSVGRSLIGNFLGNSPMWYKKTILAFLIINPIVLFGLNSLGYSGGTVVGWMLIAEFIFTLAMALKCYPLQPGGLLALEAVLIGLTKFKEEEYTELLAAPDTSVHFLKLLTDFPATASIIHEISNNLPVILLLMFMVAGIYFMKDLLLFAFTKVLLNVKSKIALSLIFSVMAAFLSAFLDALTVTAVLIAVGVGFYSVYHKVASGKKYDHSHDVSGDGEVKKDMHQDLEMFRSFLRSLLMHGAVGTALGGVMTLVGEPQNLLIAEKMGWGFVEFFMAMAPVTIPVFFSGLLTVVVVEKFKLFGYGDKCPKTVFDILQDYEKHQSSKRTTKDNMKLIVQALVGLLLVAALASHSTEVGLIGLAVIVLLTALNGIVEEHQIGKAFEEALPFTALLIVFFTIVAVIHTQHLFQPIIAYVLAQPLDQQPAMFFAANGILSAISDNVFVATVYINEIRAVYDAGTIDREHFEALAIAVNTGTNLPSVATPNGQAAFLFLLTSAIAPLLRLSYGKMVMMAMPYTIVLSVMGMIGVVYWI
jgi:Na+:H+ antiporter, NhaB family